MSDDIEAIVESVVEESSENDVPVEGVQDLGIVPEVNDEDDNSTVDLGDTSANTDASTANTITTSTDSNTANVIVANTSANVATANTEPGEIDKLFAKFGIKRKVRANGNPERVDIPRVERMIEAHERAINTKWETTLKEHTDKIETLTPAAAAFAELMPVILNEPEKFIKDVLPHFHPQYASLLSAGSTKPAANTAVSAPVDDPNDPMPQPDVHLQNGLTLYSNEQNVKLLDWRDRQKDKARLASEAEERRQQEEFSQYIEGVQRSNINLLLEAEKWEGFGTLPRDAAGNFDPKGALNDVQAAVLQEMTTNKRLGMEGAYHKVMRERNKIDPNKIRQQTIEELQRKARSTSAPVSSGAPVVAEDRSIDDIVAEVVSRNQ